MAHIDTLQVYKEYLSGGYTESQAITALKALNASFDGVATKEDLNSLEKRIDSKFDTKFGMLEKACIAIIVLLLKVAFWP